MVPVLNQEPAPDEWKYHPFDLGECEDLENYEPGGFHPVHLGDVFDGRYHVAHKLGFGGFSTVWLSRDALKNCWAALKIVAARESATCADRFATVSNNPNIAGSRLFAVPDRQFWVEGPNGQHLCLVLPVLGPDLSALSKGIYSRINPVFARALSLQATQALAHLHASGLCHGDFTTANMALRLTHEFDSYSEADLLTLSGPPQTAPLLAYSGKPPGPHAPDYIVVALDFCSFSERNLLSDDLSIIDFDQCFNMTAPPPPRQLGIPAKYLAPEVAVGQRPSPASDIWALGCAIFRVRAGDDLFFDYDTACPADALRQIVKTMGEASLPEEWRRTRFDEEGHAVVTEPGGKGEDGEQFWILNESRPLESRVRGIVDELAGLVARNGSSSGGGSPSEPAEMAADGESEPVAMFEDEAGAALRVPYPAALRSRLWKPTAVYVDGEYVADYSEETDRLLEAFPRIDESEAPLLLDFLSRVFTYDPGSRATAKELIAHPWFALPGSVE